MRTLATLALLTSLALLTACNTVHGMGQDVKSVGRVFTNHPDGPRDHDR